jgi:hypothetical protein
MKMSSDVTIYCMIVRMGIRSLSDCDSDMYSTSVVDRAISDCSFDVHKIGQSA